MDTERLLREEDEVWAGFLAALARVPAERIEEPTLTPGGWSVKDAMFHVGYWLDDCARVLGSIAMGTFDPAEENDADIEAANAEGFERSREMGVEPVRTWLADARDRARTAFASLDEVTPDAWEWFEESGPLHYRKHIEDLDAWVRRPAAPA